MANILPALFGIGAVGTAGGVGYVFREPLLKWWNTDKKVYLVKISEEVKKFNENHVCFEVGKDEEFTCTLSAIKVLNQQINSSSMNLLSSSEKLTSTNLPKKDLYYKLTIDTQEWKDKNKFEDKVKIEVKSIGETPETLAKLKIIASLSPSDRELDLGGAKEGETKNYSMSKMSYFLGKVSSIKTGSNELNTIANNTSTDYKCIFSDLPPATTPNSDCKIYKFDDTQVEKPYENMRFVGAKTPAGDIKKNSYYLVNFTTAVEPSAFVGKKLLFLETTSSNIKSVISFDSPIPALFDETTTKNLFVIN